MTHWARSNCQRAQSVLTVLALSHDRSTVHTVSLRWMYGAMFVSGVLASASHGIASMTWPSLLIVPRIGEEYGRGMRSWSICRRHRYWKTFRDACWRYPGLIRVDGRGNDNQIFGVYGADYVLQTSKCLGYVQMFIRLYRYVFGCLHKNVAKGPFFNDPMSVITQ